MKEKIIIFITGIFIGAIIATGSIYVYTIAVSKGNGNQNMEMNGGNPPSMPNSQMGQPPEMPNGNNTQVSS
ncbi:MAG: hypothetical protein IKR74_03680 [Bacilli bacterium]|nr:hypothetical protein [Bacilli bacterium]